MRSLEIVCVFVAPDGTDGSAAAMELESIVLQAMARSRHAMDGLCFIMARADSDVPFVVPQLWSEGDVAWCSSFGSDRKFRAKVRKINTAGEPCLFEDAQGVLIGSDEVAWYGRS